MALLSDQDVAARLSSLKGWEKATVGGQSGIQKTFATGNFLAGLGFVTQVAVLAEQAGHHPDVILTYPRVTLQLTTHDAGGLTGRDFELAAGIDAIGH